MEMKELSKKVKEIEMPDDMKKRIIQNCYNEMEEISMKKNRTNRLFRKPMAAVATLALCICLTGVTALAASGKLEGFFKDITRWDGAVVGTSYEQATDEIAVGAVVESDTLTVTAEMVNPTAAPYNSFDTFGIKSYEIADENGNVIVDGKATELVEMAGGTINISISIEELAQGEYTLLVHEFVGSKKADQPLVMSGSWECDFSR